MVGNTKSARNDGPSIPLALLRHWWVLVLAGLVGAAASYALLTQVSTSQVSGVINMRPAADVPTDRIDLIEDLATAVRQDTVLEEPAQQHDMAVGELRSSLNVTRLGSSNLVEVTMAWEGDDGEGYDLLRQVVESATLYLVGTESVEVPAEMQTAIEREAEARDKVTHVLLEHGGVSPLVRLSRLQDRIESGERPAPQEAEVRRALRKADRFQRLQREAELAEDFVDNLNRLREERVYARARLTNTMTIDPNEASTEPASQSTVVRRSVAAGFAAVLVAALFLIAMATRARRRSDMMRE